MTKRWHRKTDRGFTLVELMVSMTVLTIIMGILLSLLWESQRVWTSSTKRIEAFREARIAFDSLSRNLSQAVLHAYWDYDNANDPKNYVRRSELRFRSGRALLGSPPERGLTHSVFFQAPLGRTSDRNLAGLETLFSSSGYFIEYGDDSSYRPSFLNSTASVPRKRFRLLQWVQPAEEWNLFQFTSGTPGYNQATWFQSHLTGGTSKDVHILAENILALVILPQLSTADDATGTALAPNFNYSSAPASWPPIFPQDQKENQLPPILQVTMICIDEASADRLESLSPTPVSFLGLASLFQTASQLENDIQTLTSTLVQNRLEYQVFQSSLSLKSAK